MLAKISLLMFLLLSGCRHFYWTSTHESREEAKEACEEWAKKGIPYYHVKNKAEVDDNSIKGELINSRICFDSKETYGGSIEPDEDNYFMGHENNYITVRMKGKKVSGEARRKPEHGRIGHIFSWKP